MIYLKLNTKVLRSMLIRFFALEGPWLLSLLLISAMRGVKGLALAKNVCWSLSLVMLCRTSRCGESPDSRLGLRCWEYCWCWLDVAAEADNNVYKVWLAVLLTRVVYGCTCPRCVLCGWQDRGWAVTQDAWTTPVTVTLRGRPTSHTILIRATTCTSLSNQVTLKQFIKLTCRSFEIVYLLKSFKYWSTQSAAYLADFADLSGFWKAHIYIK